MYVILILYYVFVYMYCTIRMHLHTYTYVYMYVRTYLCTEDVAGSYVNIRRVCTYIRTDMSTNASIYVSAKITSIRSHHVYVSKIFYIHNMNSRITNMGIHAYIRTYMYIIQICLVLLCM